MWTGAEEEGGEFLLHLLPMPKKKTLALVNFFPASRCHSSPHTLFPSTPLSSSMTTSTALSLASHDKVIELPFDERKGIQFLMQEEMRRGTGGVLMVRDATSWAYLLLHEVEEEDVRDSLCDLMEEDKNEHYFLLVPSACKTRMDLLKYSKRRAAVNAAQWMDADAESSASAASSTSMACAEEAK